MWSGDDRGASRARTVPPCSAAYFAEPASSSRAATTTSSAVGRACRRTAPLGTGTGFVPTRLTGASRSSSARSATDRGHLGADAVADPRLVDGHQAAGLADRRDDGVGVQRRQRAQIDDLGLDALLGQQRGGPQGDRDGRADRDDRQVRALPGDARLADRHQDVAGRDLLARAVRQRHRLDVEDRVVVADRGEHQPLGVGRGAGHHDLQARARRRTRPSSPGDGRRTARRRRGCGSRPARGPRRRSCSGGSAPG